MLVLANIDTEVVGGVSICKPCTHKHEKEVRGPSFVFSIAGEKVIANPIGNSIEHDLDSIELGSFSLTVTRKDGWITLHDGQGLPESNDYREFKVDKFELYLLRLK